MTPDSTSSQYQEARALAFKARMKDFSMWLEAEGAIMMAPLEYEVLRYRAWDTTQPGKAKRAMTHVVYRKDDGRITFTGRSSMHWDLFVAGNKLPDQSKTEYVAKKLTKAREGIVGKGLSWSARTRVLIRARDGDDCWFCGEHCPEKTKDRDRQATVEHLHAQHLGGDNHIDNLVLAHRKCNHRAGHITLEEKKTLREMLRAGLKSAVEHWLNPRARKRVIP